MKLTFFYFGCSSPDHTRKHDCTKHDNDEQSFQEIEMPVMTIPEPILFKIKEKHHNYCIDCNISILKNSIRCIECSSKNLRKVERPSKEELLRLLSESNYVQVGKMFGVTDNTIRKWLKY
jgi:DNA-binding protein Fis